MTWNKAIRKLFSKDYVVTLTFYLSEGGAPYNGKYEITNAEDDISAIMAAKEEFYSQITDGYSKPIPDGKLEINCIRK